MKKKQELWFTLVQIKNGSEVAATVPFRVNPETQIRDIMAVEERLNKMAAPNYTFDLKSEWRDIEEKASDSPVLRIDARRALKEDDRG